MINYLKSKFCLVNTIKQLELKLHNQEQLLIAVEAELDRCSNKLFNKEIELSNLNNYTKELEHSINQVKAIVHKD
jgi:predicted  nucleic acid-binding Zn-ribbon protein